MTQKSLLHAVAAQIANGYETAEVPMYSEQLRMPDRKVIIKIIENLQKVFFPAYFAGGTVSHVSAETFAEFLLGEIYTDLCEQVHLAFSNTIKDEAELRERTSAVCDRFLCRLPQIQAMLMKDVAANFDGDPAAGSKEEVIFSYPGLYAIFVYRVAHELYESKVPLIPRIMSEYAHGATGIDINPGAQIGEYFFIDHGTGIVVGETTIIGDHVKLYQGVTLGALSPRHGHAVTGKRHPTVGDNATIYSGASILGGKTVIGANSVIGGNSFITESIAPNTKASTETPRMIFRVAQPKPRRREITRKQENTAGRLACGVLRFAQQIGFEEGLAPSSSPAAQKIQICSDTAAHTDMCFRLVSPGCALTIPRCRCSAPRRRARCRCRRDTAPRRRRCSYAGARRSPRW